MHHFFQIFFVVACAAGVGFWVYSIIPFLRLQAQVGRRGGDLGPSMGILKDRSHPLSKDARRLAGGILGFLICWLLAALIGFTTIATNGPHR